MKYLIFGVALLFITITATSQTVYLYDDLSDVSKWSTNANSGTQDWRINDVNYYMGDFYSTSSNNNYLVFDAGLGTGLRDAYVYQNETFPINSSKEIHLAFDQYYMRYYSTSSEQMIVSVFNNTENKWYDIQVNDQIGIDEYTNNPDFFDLDISSYLVGATATKIAFGFYTSLSGEYAWYVDDIYVYSPESGGGGGGLSGTNAAVTTISALAKLPVKLGSPHKIKAKVKNTGATSFTNLNVKLTVTGVNSFTNTQIIPTLASGDSAEVTFSGYNATKMGTNNIKVNIVITDDVASDNTYNFQQLVTYNEFSYCDTSKVITSLGSTGGKSALHTAKFYMNGSKSISKINVFISEDATNIDKQVYAVLFTKDRKVFVKSKKFTILQGDLNKYHSFLLDTFPILTNTDFFAGLAIEEGIDFFPIGAQEEDDVPIEGAYYFSGLSAATVSPQDIMLRPMIEAIAGDPAPSICLVSADLTTGKNQVIWNKYNSGSIKKYNIYKESNIAGQFNLIGSVDYSKLSVFTDPAEVGKTQMLYKITAVDTMNNESEKSPYHKTLLLQYVNEQLSWGTYEVQGKAVQFSSYIIYRGTDSSKLAPIDTISASLDRYTDTDPKAKQFKMYYRIGGVLPSGCQPTGTKKAGGGVYVQAVSNMEDNRLRSTYVANTDFDGLNLSIYPNPINASSTISYNLKSATTISINLYSLTGQKILSLTNSKQLPGEYKLKFGEQLEPGIYNLRILVNDKPISRQIIKLK